MQLKLSLNIPPHIKGVATLSCEILRSESSDNLKVKRILISAKSQGSVAARFRCGGLFICYLTMYLLLRLIVKKIKSVNTWQSYRQKINCLVCPVRFAMFYLKIRKWPDN